MQQAPNHFDELDYVSEEFEDEYGGMQQEAPTYKSPEDRRSTINSENLWKYKDSVSTKSK